MTVKGRGTFGALLDLVLPPRCPLCSGLLEEGGPPRLCSPCIDAFAWITDPICIRCGVPHVSRAPGADVCGRCVMEPPPFRMARSLAIYTGEMMAAIQALKFGGKERLGAALGLLMAERISVSFESERHDLILAVPLHPSRLRVREFNQALCLARPVALETGSRLHVDLLRRTARSPSQVGLSRKERRRNVRGAFTVARKAQVRDRAILLVDDVYTTGATVSEIASVLLRGGARFVDVYTLARGMAPHAHVQVTPSRETRLGI